MAELQVSLDFDCCLCHGAVGVTLTCSGKGLGAGPRTVATVNVPCPTCNGINTLYFQPNGTVCRVVPYRTPAQVPAASIN